MTLALDFFVPISGPKSALTMYAGILASGKSFTSIILPTRSSTISKSFKVISFICDVFFLHDYPLLSGIVVVV